MRRTHLRKPIRGLAWAMFTLAATLPAPALATWSIIMVDTETREIAVGAATCVPEIDLQNHLGVVLVDRAAACAQARVDETAVNRMLIHEELLAGTRPARIIEDLAEVDLAHQQRQYGIVNVKGDALTFTGNKTFEFSDGLTGVDGTLAYAIQGNILTGQPVLIAAEQAMLNTEGDLPAKLMAAMEAARGMGGDGRCSCPGGITTCGVPPPMFEKSAHVGFMLAARTGDVDGDCGPLTGCANGDYFMNFNVAFASAKDPDPVLQLRDEFDAWRASLVGKADAVASSATLSQDRFLADGTGGATMSIHLRDFNGDPNTGAANVTVTHAPDSAGTTAIGPVVDDGGGVFHVEIDGSEMIGRDRFFVQVDDGGRPVVVVPVPELLSLAQADLDRDGDVDREDFQGFPSCLTGPAAAGSCDGTDFDGSGAVDLRDYAVAQRQYSGAPCVGLEILQEPESVQLPCGWALNLRVTADGDPPPVYQWFLDGEAIPGAVRSRYSVSSTTAEDFGTYRVDVTNACRTITIEGIEVSERGGSCP